MFRKEITGLQHGFLNSVKVMEDIVPQNIGCLVGYSPSIARAIGRCFFRVTTPLYGVVVQSQTKICGSQDT